MNHDHHMAHGMDHSQHTTPSSVASSTPGPFTPEISGSGMSHSPMTHDNHNAGGMGGHDMMKMFFHFDLGDTVLFKSWQLESWQVTLFSCLAFYVLAGLYEGLKCYREYLLKKHVNAQRFAISIIGNDSPHHNASGDVTTTFPTASNRRSSHGKMLSMAHVVQSALHILQVAVSYTLMLGFMTFNGWLCIAILLGAGSGYFVFCWRKLTVVDVTEHCH